MARDYVRNQPQKRKPGSRRSPAKSAPSSRLPIVATVIAVLALSGFGYFLYTISGTSSTAEIVEIEDQPTPAPKAKEKTEETEKQLPEKPKEQWDYIEQLENKEVEVDVPDDPAPAIPYQMQCGSFRSLEQAQTLKAQIAFQGLESRVRRVEGSSGVWFKVILGPYERKRQAQTDLHKLSRAKMGYCQIWQWQGPLPQ